MFKREILILAAMVGMFTMVENSLALNITLKVDVIVIVRSNTLNEMTANLKNLADKFDLGETKVRMGLIDSGNLTWHIDSDACKQAVASISADEEYFESFNLVGKHILNDDRAKVVIVLAAENSGDMAKAGEAADNLRQKGALIYSIYNREAGGLQEQVENFTGNPTRVFNASNSDFNDLGPFYDDLTKAILDDLCGWKSMCRFMTSDHVCIHEVWQEPVSDFGINAQCLRIKPQSMNCTPDHCDTECNRQWPFEGKCDPKGDPDNCFGKILNRTGLPIDPALSSKLAHCPVKKLCSCEKSLHPVAITMVVGLILIPIFGAVAIFVINVKKEQGN